MLLEVQLVLPQDQLLRLLLSDQALEALLLQPLQYHAQLLLQEHTLDQLAVQLIEALLQTHLLARHTGHQALHQALTLEAVQLLQWVAATAVQADHPLAAATAAAVIAAEHRDPVDTAVAACHQEVEQAVQAAAIPVAVDK